MATIDYDPRRHPHPAIIAMPFLVLMAIALLGAVNAISRTSSPPDLTPQDWDTVLPWPEFISPMSIMADGGTQMTVHLEPGDLPPVPNCDDLDICPDNSRWRVYIRKTGAGDDLVTVELEANGKTVGEQQLLRINTAEYEQTQPIAAKGYPNGWISHIKVARFARDHGIGRLMWQAGDAALRVIFGSGGAIHLFVDNAGWGPTLLREIADDLFVYADKPGQIWAYIIR